MVSIKCSERENEIQNHRKSILYVTNTRCRTPFKIQIEVSSKKSKKYRWNKAGKSKNHYDKV